MNIKKINFSILAIFIISFSINLYFFYIEQRQMQQKELIDDIKSSLIDGKYILTKELTNYSLNSSSVYLEQKAFTTDYISSVSIADNENILVSSNKIIEHKRIDKDVVDIVNINDNLLDKDVYYKIDIRYFRDNSYYKYFLLIDFDEDFLNNHLLLGFKKSIIASLAIPIFLFIGLWFFTQSTLLKPIRQIQEYIKDKKEIENKFFVLEIDRLKEYTKNSFDSFEQVQQTLSRQVIEKSHNLVMKESKLNTLFDNINEGVIIYEVINNGENFKIIDINKYSQILENKKIEDIKGKLVTDVFPSVREFGLFDVFKNVYDSGKSQYFPLAFYKDENLTGWRENYVYRLPTGEIVAIYNDVTKQKQYEESLKKLNYQLKEKMDIINENVIISTTDAEGIIIDASKAFCKISGYTKDELIGKPHSIVRHPDMKEEVFENLWSVIKNGYTWSGEVKNKKKNGGFYWVSAKIYPIFSQGGKIDGYTSIRQDITSKKRVEELSITDELTKVYNRRYFNSIFPKEIHRAKRENKSIIFAMLDVDNFKKYNDKYGHQMGDSALEKIGEVLNTHFKRGSDYIFRLGGEEFGILFSNFDTKNAYNYINQVREDIENLSIEHLDNEEFNKLTVSIGFAMYLDNIPEEKEFYNIVDNALYKAKRKGRNRIETV